LGREFRYHQNQAMSGARHFRLRARRAVDISARISARGSEIALDTRVLDLSLEGACVELSAPVDVGDPVSVTFDLPGLWDPLALDAVVVWTAPEKGDREARAGLRFASPTGQSLLLVADLVGRETAI
jgi:hypothetical protein